MINKNQEKKIPIEKIETIAGNIGLAALTGGASVAGEALLTGGVAGLMGAGESIFGASVGSGVAAGASTALGNSYAANIVSGIAGGHGVAGRAAANRRTRPQGTPEEQTPFLGNRLGSRRGRGRSRLVPETHSTIGENATGQIPEQQPPTTLSIIIKMITKRMKNVSDNVNNISQQIRGINKTPQKGTSLVYTCC